MWNFQSIIVFIWTQTCKEIFRSALVHIIALLKENDSGTLTGNIEQIKSFANKLWVNEIYWWNNKPRKN